MSIQQSPDNIAEAQADNDQDDAHHEADDQ
jgi:hypothetical protein